MMISGLYLFSPSFATFMPFTGGGGMLMLRVMPFGRLFSMIISASMWAILEAKSKEHSPSLSGKSEIAMEGTCRKVP